MEANVYYSDDADPSLIHQKKVAVIGYGSQGHGHALNLKDSGVDVVVGLRDGSSSTAKAEAQGLTVLSVADAAQAAMHRKVVRPWGWYDSVDSGERFQVKRIGVKPGASLSLQMHYHRSEHWVVVSGTATVTNGDNEMLVRTNESTFIPAGHRHRLENPGKLDLVMIEVQSGNYLGEDDIVRFEDRYGRG